MAPARKRTARPSNIPAVDESDGKLSVSNRKASLPPQYSASGRPVRRTSKRSKESAFVDSTYAISNDSSESDDAADDVTPGPSRKRKRTPPPALIPDRFLVRSVHSTPGPALGAEQEVLTPSPAALTSTQPLSLTFNIPLGFQGPLTINIDGDVLKNASIGSVSSISSEGESHSLHKVPASRKKNEINSQSLPGKVGFLDLPPEIRNQVYRATFIKGQFRLSFSSPKNFQRTAALLQTCRQVAHEGASILYSESEFHFRRNMSTRTPLWTTDSREIGFSDIHRFLKMIGPSNVARLRHVFFMLEDAVPCLNPQYKTAEERRYVHDEHLKAALRIIADQGRLQTLKLGFFGRRSIAESDSNFLNELKAIKADGVEVLARRCHPDWPRLYNNLQWPKIFFRLALDVKMAVTRQKKFYPNWKTGRADFFDMDSDDETREARLCDECGDVHV